MSNIVELISANHAWFQAIAGCVGIAVAVSFLFFVAALFMRGRNGRYK